MNSIFNPKFKNVTDRFSVNKQLVNFDTVNELIYKLFTRRRK